MSRAAANQEPRTKNQERGTKNSRAAAPYFNLNSQLKLLKPLPFPRRGFLCPSPRLNLNCRSAANLNLNWCVAPHCRAAASFIKPDKLGLSRYQLDGMD